MCERERERERQSGCVRAQGRDNTVKGVRGVRGVREDDSRTVKKKGYN